MAERQLMRLLLVDADGLKRYNVSKALRRVGYMVREADSGEAALEQYSQGDYDLILSEIALAGMSGLDLLRRLKRQSPDAIVILMAEAASVDDAIQALRLGASDLLVMPFASEDIRESVERGIDTARGLRRRRRLLDTLERAVNELSRDAAASVDNNPQADFNSPARQPSSRPALRGSSIPLGPLAILPGNYQIRAGDKAISLTPTEFDLLLYLAANRSRVATCQELVREVRGYQSEEAEAREVIRPHVSNLRRKLKGLGEIDLIVNVRGIGYRLAELPAGE